jgi:hypothetical protein
MLQAEVHLSFAWLHIAAAQRLQAPAEETRAPSNVPSIPAGAQLEKALTEARGFEATISASQAEWTREVLRRTACVSYVAGEACEVAVQASWNPQDYGTYHDLLNREERRLDETFGNMMPDELPGPVAAAAEVWLDDAYDNITLAQTCITTRREQEDERLAAPEGHPEPPDGGTSAEKAQRLWILRALRQTSYVSHMSLEVCDDSTKADWSIWSCREFRRLLDEEMMAVCRIYMEVELADLPVHEEKAAKGWLTSAHKDGECAREHIGTRIRSLVELGALLHPVKGNSSGGTQQEEQAEDAAARARRQASRIPEVPRKSQVAGEADAKTTETRSGQQRDPACPHAPDGAKVDLVDSTSESDTSDPGGMPQLVRKSSAPDTRSRKKRRAETRRQRAAQEAALKLPAAKPRKRTGGPPLPRKHEHKICGGGVASTGAIPRVAREARDRGEDKVRNEATIPRAEEQLTAEAKESAGRGPLQGPGTDAGSIMGTSDAGTPAPDQPPGERDGFARELASTMSTIASLVIKASGRSVSNGGWLYFSGASEDYRPFRTKRRLFQETYHKVTPQKPLVNMFREWNLADVGKYILRRQGSRYSPYKN